MVDLQLTGKRALVTGGSRGIGRVTTLALARAGAQVVTCHHRDGADADGLARELEEHGQPDRLIKADVTSEPDVERLIGACRELLGGLDVVVNNAGVDGSGPIHELGVDEWRRVVDTNVTAYCFIVQATLPLLSNGASVINLGASVALRGRPSAAHYTAAKAAIIGLTRSLAKELGPRGIRVNTVAPGIIEAEPGAGLPPDLRDRISAMTALGRLGTPQDVAGAVLFLAGDASRYISGTTLNVDGGM